ncbi:MULTISPECIES: hypothetical protein [Mycobacteriaceae]|uniref:hypothetical protein n=1 Tax=Mycobacteriaceae TaxID=1762 RepID=UPI000991C9F9|nr:MULTISPECIES: hypothetical protein [Mycobacteriaceae]MDO3058493.1 hypothetical protein [Mycobacteroides abscessus subsp. abscessus]MDO3277971.1 hypothetical protein [Mycobacteroides abscessus subsp. abscessus]
MSRPNALEWANRPDTPNLKGIRRALVADGIYVVALHRGPDLWVTTFGENWPEETVYRGVCEDDALAAAQRHHDARQRALAWERYMLDNDPPKADLEARIHALENPPCCEGGPQWGHAWTCPKCPD